MVDVFMNITELIETVKDEQINKTWGTEYIIVNEPEYGLKVLIINSGKSTSYHYHTIKKETLIVIEGKAEVKLENGNVILSKGDKLTVKPNTLHSIKALEYTVILEVSTQPLHDSVRLTVTE